MYTIHIIQALHIINIFEFNFKRTLPSLFFDYNQDSVYLAHTDIFYRFKYWCYNTIVVQLLHLKFYFRPLEG